ncbi:MAG: TRAP transporter small permease [Spirochaetae bacterium HGW-Spirochaetae-7]|jgi:TRAP-type C4-dicarboxylate transport system permease small subunit|nr:MAG: TRAP transporter small permease [Spirochaetae bacterium HGW-Spirochaetae-7]
MQQKIVGFFNLVHICLVYLAKLMMVAMVLITFTNVVLRYGFNSGLMWSEEVALLLSVWFIFIAMSLGVKQGLHINITLIPVAKLPRVVARALDVLKSIVILGVAVVMLLDGWKLVAITMKSIMPATQWPAGLLYAALPVSAVIMIYESLADIFGLDTKDKTVDDFLAGTGSIRDVLGDFHA